jgi:hypothetical protein
VVKDDSVTLLASVNAGVSYVAVDVSVTVVLLYVPEAVAVFEWDPEEAVPALSTQVAS